MFQEFFLDSAFARSMVKNVLNELNVFAKFFEQFFNQYVTFDKLDYLIQ